MDRAGIGALEARDLTQDRRLAGARRPEQHEHQAGTQVDVEARVNREPAGEPLRDLKIQWRGFNHTDRCSEYVDARMPNETISSSSDVRAAAA